MLPTKVKANLGNTHRGFCGIHVEELVWARKLEFKVVEPARNIDVINNYLIWKSV